MIVLCATNRDGAKTRQIAKRVATLLGERGVTPVELDLANLKPDIFTAEAYDKKPEWFLEEFQKPVLETQGMIVVVPEYNGSFPGVAKYFVDMLKFPDSLQGLPIAFIGCAAGQWGATRSVEQLTQIFQYRSAHIYGKRLFVPKVHEAIDNAGTLGKLEERLNSLLDGFIKFSAVVKSGQL